jgi:hypothetical protein
LIQEDAPSSPRHLEHSRGVLASGHKSQSEQDWAYAKRAVARGDDPETVIQRIADYRAEDKHDPLYYARLTVNKAQIDLQREASEVAKTGTQTPDQPPSERAILGRE